MQLNDFLQVSEDVLYVVGRKDAVSAQSLAEDAVQHPQLTQVSALSDEQL